MTPKQAKQAWSYSVGDHGDTVRVYERTLGGVIYIAAWDPTLRDGQGGYHRHSLKHRDRESAKKEARRVAVALESTAKAGLNPTLGYLFDLYRKSELEPRVLESGETVLPRVKAGTRRWLVPALAAWESYLGRAFAVADLTTKEWEDFKRARRTGEIDGRGRVAEPDARRPVTPGTVNLNLDGLAMALNWALRRRVDGRPLLTRNPVWRFPYFDDANPERSIWTQERYEAGLTAAERHTMQVEWNGPRERVKSHLADILVILHETGRRISQVCQLRYQDLRLQEGRHGKIQWPADTDKAGKRWLTPISPAARKRLLEILRRRPGLGAAPLFPAPRNRNEPVGDEVLRQWLRAVLESAGLPRLPREAFHGVRRKWRTERKHLPDVDVAKAGGWRSIPTMNRSYLQADDAGVLDAVLDRRALRERSS